MDLFPQERLKHSVIMKPSTSKQTSVWKGIFAGHSTEKKESVRYYYGSIRYSDMSAEI